MKDYSVKMNRYFDKKERLNKLGKIHPVAAFQKEIK